MSKSVKKNYVILTHRFGGFKQRERYNATWYTRQRLLERVASAEYYKENSILSNLDNSILCTYRTGLDGLNHDLFWLYSETIKYCICKKNANGELEIADINKLVRDIKPIIAKKVKRRAERSKYWYYTKKTKEFKFRRGPVAYSGRRYKFGSYYRFPKLGMVKREANDAEYAEYCKPCYRLNNLPVWDDRPRHIDKSWKTSCKVKHQWQKHLPKHSDTIQYTKRTYDLSE